MRETIDFTDPRLGRHIEHDPASKNYRLAAATADVEWHDKFIRVIDPKPNPNQPNGCCTMVAEAIMLNAMGNRRLGRVLGMDWVQQAYSYETANDEFPGAWPPDDTGSSGLAAAKTSVHYGHASGYDWVFNGATGVVNAIMANKVISVGTVWKKGMWDAVGTRTGLPIIAPTGVNVGGHEWAVRGFALKPKLVLGRCWWGGWRDFWMKFEHLDDLLLGQSGDAHWTRSV